MAEVIKAQTYKPTDRNASSLRERIDAFPQILAELEKVHVARVEGNLQAEIDAIDRVLTIDPSRRDLASRGEELKAALREEKYASFIREGLSRVEAEDISGSIKSYEQARSIYRDRKEAAFLKKKIDELQKRIDVREWLASADKHTGKDEWMKALGFYRQVLQLEPDNKTALQGEQVGVEITSLGSEIEKHINNPDRLSAQNVSGIAVVLVDRARVLKVFSPRLFSLSEELSGLLQLHERKVQVRILSDGNTSIAIRGVGRIGEVEEKIIHLKPGSYTFDGKRQGYISKLVHLKVPIGEESVEVKVICDELI